MARQDTGETTRHREAFEYYYTLGHDRSLHQVAEKFAITDRTVGGWSMKFNWAERVRQRDMEVNKRMSEGVVDEIVNEKAKYRTIIKAVMNDFLKDLKSGTGEIKIRNVYDLERLVKLDLLLMGEATDNTKQTVSHSLTEADLKELERVNTSMREGIIQDLEDDEEVEE